MQHPQVDPSRSCSCSSCFYKNASDSPSVKDMVQGGSKIDKLFLGKFLPMREQKLLDRLIRTRAVYDDIRNQLLSDTSADAESGPQRHEPEVDTSSTVQQLVSYVDKGGAGQAPLSDCCSCCSCDSIISLLAGNAARARMVHQQQRSHSTLGQSMRHGEDRIRQRAHRDDRLAKKRAAHHAAKPIRSDPCGCYNPRRKGLVKKVSAVFSKKTKMSRVHVHSTSPGEMARLSRTRMSGKMRKQKRESGMGEAIRHSVTKMKQTKRKLEAGVRRSVESMHDISRIVKKSISGSFQNFAEIARAKHGRDLTDAELAKLYEESFGVKLDDNLNYDEIMDKWACDYVCDPEECQPEECFQKKKQKLRSRGTKKQVTDTSISSETSVKAKQKHTTAGTDMKKKKIAAVKTKQDKVTKPFKRPDTSSASDIGIQVKQKRPSLASGTQAKKKIPDITKTKAEQNEVKKLIKQTETSSGSGTGAQAKQTKAVQGTVSKKVTTGEDKHSIKHVGRDKKNTLKDADKKSRHHSVDKNIERKSKKAGERSKSVESRLPSKSSQVSLKPASKAAPKKKPPSAGLPPKSKSVHKVSSKTSQAGMQLKEKKKIVTKGATVKRPTVSKVEKPPRESPDQQIVKPFKERHETKPVVGRRPATRIGSNLSFNLEFSKTKLAPEIGPAQIKVRRKSRETMRTRTSLRHKTSSTIRGEKKQAQTNAHSLRRCFCTLQLKNNAKINKTDLQKEKLAKKRQAKKHVTRSMQTIRSTQKVPRVHDLLPYECEPMICIPGECDPHQCLKLIKKRNLKLHAAQTNTPKAGNRTMSTPSLSPKTASTGATETVSSNVISRGKKIRQTHRESKKKNQRRGRPRRQAVRISSSFSFNVEFYRGDAPTSGLRSLDQLGSPQRDSIKLEIKGTNRTINDRTNTMYHAVPKHRNKAAHRSGARLAHASSQSYSTMRSRDMVTQHDLRRCFCTLKLPKKGNIKAKARTYSNHGTVTSDLNGPTVEVRHMAEKGTKRRPQPKLLPYECEPGICITGECNPYECQKLINIRNVKRKAKGSGTDNLKSKSTYSITGKSIGSAKEVQSDVMAPKREVQKKHKVRHQKYSSSKHHESAMEPIRSHRDSSLHPRKQAVRIGSNFSFNIEFYKDKSPGIMVTKSGLENKRQPKSFTKSYSHGIATVEKHSSIGENTNKSSKTQKTITAKAKGKNKGVNKKSVLERCFCTLNLIKSSDTRKNQLKTEKNKKHKHENTTYGQRNVRNQLNYDPNACEPNFCVPNECDTNRCLKRIKKRNYGRSQSTDTFGAPVKRRGSQSIVIRNANRATGIKPMLKRCFCTLKLQNKNKNTPKNAAGPLSRKIEATVMPAQIFYSNAYTHNNEHCNKSYRSDKKYNNLQHTSLPAYKDRKTTSKSSKANIFKKISSIFKMSCNSLSRRYSKQETRANHQRNDHYKAKRIKEIIDGTMYSYDYDPRMHIIKANEQYESYDYLGRKHKHIRFQNSITCAHSSCIVPDYCVLPHISKRAISTESRIVSCASRLNSQLSVRKQKQQMDISSHTIVNDFYKREVHLTNIILKDTDEPKNKHRSRYANYGLEKKKRSKMEKDINAQYKLREKNRSKPLTDFDKTPNHNLATKFKLPDGKNNTLTIGRVHALEGNPFNRNKLRSMFCTNSKEPCRCLYTGDISKCQSEICKAKQKSDKVSEKAPAPKPYTIVKISGEGLSKDLSMTRDPHTPEKYLVGVGAANKLNFKIEKEIYTDTNEFVAVPKKIKSKNLKVKKKNEIYNMNTLDPKTNQSNAKNIIKVNNENLKKKKDNNNSRDHTTNGESHNLACKNTCANCKLNALRVKMPNRIKSKDKKQTNMTGMETILPYKPAKFNKNGSKTCCTACSCSIDFCPKDGSKASSNRTKKLNPSPGRKSNKKSSIFKGLRGIIFPKRKDLGCKEKLEINLPLNEIKTNLVKKSKSERKTHTDEHYQPNRSKSAKFPTTDRDDKDKKKRNLKKCPRYIENNPGTIDQQILKGGGELYNPVSTKKVKKVKFAANPEMVDDNPMKNKIKKIENELIALKEEIRSQNLQHDRSLNKDLNSGNAARSHFKHFFVHKNKKIEKNESDYIEVKISGRKLRKDICEPIDQKNNTLVTVSGSYIGTQITKRADKPKPTTDDKSKKKKKQKNKDKNMKKLSEEKKGEIKKNKLPTDNKPFAPETKKKKEVSIPGYHSVRIKPGSCRCCVCSKKIMKPVALKQKKGKPQKCVCGSSKCTKQLKKEEAAKAKLAREKALRRRPCVCGSPACRSLSNLAQSGVITCLKKMMKRKMCKCGNPSCECKKVVNALIKKKAQEKKRQEYYIGLRKQRHIADERRASKQRKYDKYMEKKAKSNKYAGCPMLWAESVVDLTKLGLTSTAVLTRSLYRAATDPDTTGATIKSVVKHPRQGINICKKIVKESGAPSTLKRTKYRFACIGVIRWMKDFMENHAFTNFLLHLHESDPTKRMKMKKKKRKIEQKEPFDFQCSLYMASMRKRPFWKLYFLVPWFYPHCISLLTLWRQFTDVMLFILAIVVWSPILICIEAIRMFICCCLCTA